MQSNQSRYTDTLFDASAQLETHVWRSSAFQTTLGLRKEDMSHGAYGTDPSVEQAAAGLFGVTVPYGFDRGYTGPYAGALATFDTRRPKTTAL